ncbi:MAG: methylmalonyl-CoA epimerase [Candidatus Sericytochromatia bacterium]|nr:methylmalonyl-CoA epimerase [Candidatus Tanganyikabacteria bacterium]
MPEAPRFIDHVGIAVRSLDEAIPFWRDTLGLVLHEVEIVADQQVRTAVFMAGANRIELLEPTGPDSPIARFIEKRGEGIHHLALRTGDVAGALGALREAGCRLVDEQPRPGAGGAQIAFVHPKSTGGVLLELSSRD